MTMLASPRSSHLGSTVSIAVTVLGTALILPPARGWDSAAGNPTHATHSYLTEWAIDQLKEVYPELDQHRQALIDGANTELHELPSRDYEKNMSKKYGVELENLRVQHKGTNEGCDDIEGWWKEIQAAHQQGEKVRAYFLLGVLLHMVQDMGVPAHANKVYHQGNVTEFDNFEFLALFNWKPSFDDINRTNPTFKEPWKYYAFSQEWTHADAPGYQNRDSFSKFWLTASKSERRLLRNRQGRTCHLTMWTLASAAKAFGL